MFSRLHLVMLFMVSVFVVFCATMAHSLPVEWSGPIIFVIGCVLLAADAVSDRFPSSFRPSRFSVRMPDGTLIEGDIPEDPAGRAVVLREVALAYRSRIASRQGELVPVMVERSRR